MLMEIVESVVTQLTIKKKLDPVEWNNIKIIQKYFEDLYKNGSSSTPFTYGANVDGIDVILSREGFPSGFHWRLYIGNGSDSRHNIDCVMLQTPDVVDEFLQNFLKWVRRNASTLKELANQKEMKLEDFVAKEIMRLKNVYCSNN